MTQIFQKIVWNCGIFSNQSTANLPANLPVKTLCKSVKTWQNYGREFVASVFWPILYVCTCISIATAGMWSTAE